MLGPLIYLVQITSGVFWRRHIDHLRPIGDSVNVQNQCNPTSPPLPDFSVQSDFVPIADSENNESIPPPEPAAVVEHPCTTEHRYPKRPNQRPPSRYP